MSSFNIQSDGLQSLTDTSKFVSYDDRNSKVPSQPGVYAFWWTDDSEFELLKKLNLNVSIKGKKDAVDNKDIADITIDGFIHHNIKWQIKPLSNEGNDKKLCFYVGKSHNIAERIKLHVHHPLEFGKTDWYRHKDDKKHEKIKAIDDQNRIYKPTTACQFRAGIEHLFKNNKRSQDILNRHIKIAYHECPDMVERFYLEDLAIGYLRPWFNLDSER